MTTRRIAARAWGVVALVFAPFVVSVHAADEGVQVVAPDAAPEVQAALTEAWQALGPDYKPRTEHLLDDGSPVYINRLVQEASPYLLQHAHNPVNWHPWGEEAFARALAEDKPVFLSIGYSTCHWCHVMERESFENEAIADYMNEHFIAIKVDREQLPDVDALYMTAVQMLTGRGGWPMSSFLDEQGRPYFGGTYYPPDVFQDLLERVNTVWTTRRDALMAEADTIAQALADIGTVTEQSESVGMAELGAARDNLLATHDDFYGGFGGAPKFPQESTLMFLLEHAQRTSDRDALNAVDLTLERMAAGGIHDQIGGGFHRYAVDQIWLVPHFEKMLYNQASLARVYTLAADLTGKAAHERTARGILDYVLREMTSEEGLFYSATDADSEGREGAFFTWTLEQLEDALSPEDADIAATLWGVDHVGNFEGETILHRPLELDLLARRLDLGVEELLEKRGSLAASLREARATREAPLRDDKSLTGWNGMMIAALAEAGHSLDEPRYIVAAEQAAEMLWDTAWSAENGLKRSRYRGETSLPGRQTDYAWYADGLLALHDATGDTLWLQRAEAVMQEMQAVFTSPDGGYFLGEASVGGTVMVSRPRDIHDASTPSGNGVALSVLARLHDRTGNRDYDLAAKQLIAAFSGLVAQGHSGLGAFMSGVALHAEGPQSAVQFAGRGTARAQARVVEDGRVEVDIALADGWHLNSAAPLQDYLIATQLTDAGGTELPDSRYPEPTVRTLAFQSEALSLYEEGAQLDGQLPSELNELGLATVKLRVQVCSDEVCLAPETLEWSLRPEPS